MSTLHRRLCPWFGAMWLVGCSANGCGGPPPGALPDLAPAVVEAPADHSLPPAVIESLPAASPATIVDLRLDGVYVDNGELVESWPSDALQRARASSSEPDWPRVEVSLPAPSEQTREIPALRAALTRTREAERAASGAGRGAGTFNLRVADAVPFRALQRVLFTSAMAGYGPPRVLLASEDGPRLLAWPASLPRNAPTAEQIAALVRGEPLPEDPNALAAPRRPAGVVLRPDGSLLVQLAEATQTAGCDAASEEDDPVTVLPDAPPGAIGRCMDALHPRTDEDAITLSIDGDVPFSTLSPVLQHATRVFEQVRIRRRSAP